MRQQHLLSEQGFSPSPRAAPLEPTVANNISVRQLCVSWASRDPFLRPYPVDSFESSVIGRIWLTSPARASAPRPRSSPEDGQVRPGSGRPSASSLRRKGRITGIYRGSFVEASSGRDLRPCPDAIPGSLSPRPESARYETPPCARAILPISTSSCPYVRFAVSPGASPAAPLRYVLLVRSSRSLAPAAEPPWALSRPSSSECNSSASQDLPRAGRWWRARRWS